MSKADLYSKEYPPFYFIGWKSCCPLITCPIPSHACIFKKGVLQFSVPKKVAGGDVIIHNDIKRWSFCPSKRLAMGPYPAQKMFQIDGLDIFFHRCRMINKIDLLAASVNRLPLR